MRAAHGVAVAGDAGPGAAAVGRAPDLAVLGLASVPRNPVAGLEHRIDALRIRGRDRHRDLAHREVGQPDAVIRTIELLPAVAAVARDVQAAAGSAAGAAIRVNLQLPRPREQVARVDGVESDVGAPRVLVHEEHVLPALAAVHGAEDAAFGLRPVGVAERADVDDVGIGRMDGEPGNASGLFEPHERPGHPAVGGLVDPLPDGDVAADLPLAGAGPDDVGIGQGHPQRADRLHRLVVEDGVPVNAAVGGLVDAPGGGADVVGVGVAGQTGGRGEAVALGADVAPLEVGVALGSGSLLGGGRRGGRGQGQEEEGERTGSEGVHGRSRGRWGRIKTVCRRAAPETSVSRRVQVRFSFREWPVKTRKRSRYGKNRTTCSSRQSGMHWTSGRNRHLPAPSASHGDCAGLVEPLRLNCFSRPQGSGGTRRRIASPRRSGRFRRR